MGKPNNYLRIKPLYHKIDKEYGVFFKHTDLLKSKETNVNYKTIISLINTGTGNKATLEREQVYTNNQLPDSKAEELAEALGKALYPVSVLTNINGDFENILNLEEIQERWNNQKPTITGYFKGEFVEKQIQKMDTVYNNPYQIIKMLNNNLFCFFYFFALYKDYENNDKIKTFIPVYPFQKPVLFNLSQTLIPEKTSTEKTLIHLEGFSIPSEKYPHKKEINLLYKLNPDFSIFSIEGSINIPQKKTIEIGVYEQEETTDLYTNHTKTTIPWEGEEVKEKATFIKDAWSFFKKGELK